MDLSDLRLHALQQASADCRFTVAGQACQAAPEVIATRARVYLEFLVNGMPARQYPAPKQKAPKKRR